MLAGACLEQYESATSAAAWIGLDSWTTVRLTGSDRAAFLHNLCTNDIRNLAAGQGCEAFLCDVKGKIIGHVAALAAEDGLVLFTVPDQAARLVEHLDRYIIRENVQLADVTMDVYWTLLVGPRAPSLIANLADGLGADLPAWSHVNAAIVGTPMRVVRCPWLWPGSLLLASPRGARDALCAAAAAAGAKQATADVWHTLRVESGYPLYGIDFDGTNLAQEVGRDAEAISFRKGCYLGQETIARIDALGHVNKRLATVVFEGPAKPTPGAELTLAGRVVGRVSSVAWSMRRQRLAGLAMVNRGCFDVGCELQCQGATVAVISTPAATGLSGV